MLFVPQFSSDFTDYMCKVLKSQKVAFTHLAIGIDCQVTHHVVAMVKVAE